ncbi:hypothetical protein H4R33_004550 [Dimargaris cristalligena]|nr:hypothetical protein H4R33_004550 [Dimargaris cristalligena]
MATFGKITARYFRGSDCEYTCPTNTEAPISSFATLSNELLQTQAAINDHLTSLMKAEGSVVDEQDGFEDEEIDNDNDDDDDDNDSIAHVEDLELAEASPRGPQLKRVKSDNAPPS